jgi:hypothetical protein
MPGVSTGAVPTHSLSPFSPQTGGPVRALQATVVRSGSVLHFQYTLDGDLSRIRIPERRPSTATNELWKHTCFEAFVMRAPESADYRELNFSPSTQWAAYSFDRYREGMASVAMTESPDIRLETASSRLQIDVRVSADALFPAATFRIALAAVIEDNSGTLSYWALKHAPSRPDFHHPAGFILEV